MGNSNVINFGGLRIGGISGIHKYCDAMKGYYERPPYDSQSIVSINHTRQYEIDKFLLLKEPLDIMISHDWPDVIYKYGNTQELLKKKPHFSYSVVHKERSSRNDIKNQSLGSPSLSELLFTLRVYVYQFLEWLCSPNTGLQLISTSNSQRLSDMTMSRIQI